VESTGRNNILKQKSFMLKCLNFLDNIVIKSKKIGEDITNSIKSI